MRIRALFFKLLVFLMGLGNPSAWAKNSPEVIFQNLQKYGANFEKQMATNPKLSQVPGSQQLLSAYQKFKAESVSENPELRFKAAAQYYETVAKIQSDYKLSPRGGSTEARTVGTYAFIGRDGTGSYLKAVRERREAAAANVQKVEEASTDRALPSSEIISKKSGARFEAEGAPDRDAASAPSKDAIKVENKVESGENTGFTDSAAARHRQDQLDRESVKKMDAEKTQKPAEPSAEEKDAAWKKNVEAHTARCFYAGYQGFDVGGKCKPASDDPARQNEQSGDFGTAETNLKCGEGLLACNPVLFGLGENGKALCVPRTKDATKSCKKSSKLKEPCNPDELINPKMKTDCAAREKVRADFKAAMTKSRSKEAFARIRRSLGMSCRSRQVDQAKKLGIAAAKRVNDADFDETCKDLDSQFALVGKIVDGERVDKGDRDSKPAAVKEDGVQ